MTQKPKLPNFLNFGFQIRTENCFKDSIRDISRKNGAAIFLTASPDNSNLTPEKIQSTCSIIIPKPVNIALNIALQLCNQKLYPNSFRVPLKLFKNLFKKTQYQNLKNWSKITIIAENF